jgi:hypothetical protein
MGDKLRHHKGSFNLELLVSKRASRLFCSFPEGSYDVLGAFVCHLGLRSTSSLTSPSSMCKALWTVLAFSEACFTSTNMSLSFSIWTKLEGHGAG